MGDFENRKKVHYTFDEQLSHKMCIGFWHVSQSLLRVFSSKCVWKETFYCMHLPDAIYTLVQNSNFCPKIQF